MSLACRLCLSRAFCQCSSTATVRRRSTGSCGCSGLRAATSEQRARRNLARGVALAARRRNAHLARCRRRRLAGRDGRGQLGVGGRRRRRRAPRPRGCSRRAHSAPTDQRGRRDTLVPSPRPRRSPLDVQHAPARAPSLTCDRGQRPRPAARACSSPRNRIGGSSPPGSAVVPVVVVCASVPESVPVAILGDCGRERNPSFAGIR